MGKYMRKCRGAAGEEVAAVEVAQVVGVRTRSRSAAASAVTGGVAKVATRRKKALTPTNVTAGEPAAVGAGEGSGGCYIHLRSRMLFLAPPQQSSVPTAAEAAAGAGHGAALAAGLSRCSSTASSVVLGVGAQDRSHACRSDAAEVGGDHVPEVSANNSGNGPDRERRETTPSSRVHGELSDLESDLAGQKGGRSLPAPTSASKPIVPPAEEIEEFFAAAEAAHARRFASKYNFDFVRGVPLDGAGQFEWTPVVSI